MTDIIERIRTCAQGCQWHPAGDLSVQEEILTEAADEIERLRATLKDAEKALLGMTGSDNLRVAKALLIVQTGSDEQKAQTEGTK